MHAYKEYNYLNSVLACSVYAYVASPVYQSTLLYG